MRFTLLAASFFSFSLFSFAANSAQDIITQNDGSEIRGILIEENFDSGQYTMQLNNGNRLIIDKSNIKTISRGNTQGASTTFTSSPATRPHERKTRLSLYIGSLKHTIKMSDSTTSLTGHYSGLNFGGQLNINRHLAFYGDLNIGTLDSIDAVDNGYSFRLSGNQVDEAYTSTQLSALINSSLEQGPRIFAGLGVFRESYVTTDYTEDFNGLLMQLGAGYSWKRFQIMLRYNYLVSADYHSDVDRSTNTHFQLGMNF